MAKSQVERAPEYSFDDIQEFSKYIPKYDITNEKGEYLPWSKFKWRVPKEDAVNIWKAVKFKRSIAAKYLSIVDEHGKPFWYCSHHAMESKIHRIVKIAGASVGAVAGGVASNNIQHKFLVSSLLMEEAITSAQLEGASTTREVAKKMLAESRDPVDEDERMILNNYLLLRFAEQHKDSPLTIDLILEFHRIATLGTTENKVVPGEFRQDDSIYVGDRDGEIAHQPPTYIEIPTRMHMLCKFANTEHSGQNGSEFLNPIVKAICLHFMMGFEHPFRDGNGRTARALFYWFMLKNEYQLFKYVSISKLLKDSPRDYGLSFWYCEKDSGDLTYFIDYQLDIIIKALNELQDYLKKKTEEFQEVVGLLENSKFKDSLNFHQKNIIKKGTKEPGRYFTAKEISSDYEISENTARKYLSELCNYDLLFESKIGKKIIYVVPSDLRHRLSANDRKAKDKKIAKQ